MTTRILLLLALTLVTHQMASAQQPTVTVKAAAPEYRSQAKIPPDVATKTALARVPGGRVREAELEKEHGRLVYSFDIVAPRRRGVEEVQVDARSGDVISNQHESPVAESKERVNEQAHP